MKKYSLLILFLSIELFGFSNQLKYSVFPNFINQLFNEHFFALKIICAVLISAAVYRIWQDLAKKEKQPLFMVYLIKGFQSKGSDFLGFLNILYTLCHIAWIGDELAAGEVLNAIIRVNFLIIYPSVAALYLIADQKDATIKHEPKVLITPLSLFNEQDIVNNQAEINLKHYIINDNFVVDTQKDVVRKVYNGTEDYYRAWGNFDPIRKSIILHQKSLELIILLVSKEVDAKLEPLKGQPHSPIEIINKFCHQTLKMPKMEVIKSNDQFLLTDNNFAGNDMKATGTVIDKVVDYLINKKKYEERDIIFNITSGTATSSGAMVLRAIPADRKAEYVNQATGLIEEVELDIFQVKDLWNELIEKVS